MIDQIVDMTRILSVLKQPTIVGDELCLVVACRSKAAKDRVVSFLKEAKKYYRIVFSVRGNQIIIKDDQKAYEKDEDKDSYLGIPGDERDFIDISLVESIANEINSQVIRVKSTPYELEIYWERPDRETSSFSKEIISFPEDRDWCRNYLTPLMVQIIENFKNLSYFIGLNFVTIDNINYIEKITLLEFFVKEVKKGT